MGSGERKRCSNMAPVRRLRNLAWIKARRFPGVRCSTLNTECRSLLCLMTIPGRNWVAGIAMLLRLLTLVTLPGRAVRLNASQLVQLLTPAVRNNFGLDQLCHVCHQRARLEGPN